MLGDGRAAPHLQALLAESSKERRGVRQWAAFFLSEIGRDATGEPGANPKALHGPEEDPVEEEAIQRKAAQRVADGIGDLPTQFKGKERVTRVTSCQASNRWSSSSNGTHCQKTRPSVLIGK
jgi:hypothetical protein